MHRNIYRYTEYMENIESPDLVKSRVRTCLKSWHPDLIGHPSISENDVHEVMHILTALTGKTTLQVWPQGSFETGTKVIFPPAGTEKTNKTIYLPATPEEFITLLEQIRKTGKFPDTEFPQVKLKVERNTNDKERKQEDDPTLAKFQKFVMECDSLDKLERSFELFSLYSEEQLFSASIPQLIDGRAEFLLSANSWTAQSEQDIESARAAIAQWRFFDEASRTRAAANLELRLQEKPIEAGKHTTSANTEQDETRKERERTARQEFVARVRDAQTQEQLDVIAQDVNKFDFFNRGELGVVRSVIARKFKVFGRIWEG